MRVISTASPSPRLLNSVVPELRETKAGRTSVRSRLKVASVFSGNGRAIFLGIILGASVLVTIGIFYDRHQKARLSEESRRKFLTVARHSLSPSAPIVVKIEAGAVHVTAIALGHPRLAIINGQQVSEGDRITVHMPAASVAVTLRVLKISDGRIELSDGTQVITARLEIPNARLHKN